MAWFSLSPARPEEPCIVGARVRLRPLRHEDYAQWAALRRASADFLAPWEPVRDPADLDRRAFRNRVLNAHQEMRADLAYPYLIFLADSDQLVGGLTLGLVRRGVAQTCALGYWMGEAFAGQGLMSDAVAAASRHAFTALRLRRIEAACLPHNFASRRVLEKNGFQLEGLARQYLCIAGVWADHVTYALLRDDPQPGSSGALRSAAHA